MRIGLGLGTGVFIGGDVSTVNIAPWQALGKAREYPRSVSRRHSLPCSSLVLGAGSLRLVSALRRLQSDVEADDARADACGSTDGRAGSHRRRASAPAVKNEDFLYLEDVTGEKALAFARAHNAVSREAAHVGAGLPGAPGRASSRSTARRSSIPSPRIAERQRPQLLDGRRAPARALATDHARRLQEAEAHLDDAPRRRRAQQGRERELRLPRRGVPLSAAQAMPRPALEGRRRRGDRPRVRRRHEGVRDERLRPPRGEEPRSRGRTRTPSTSATDFGPGSLTKCRLPAHRQGVEARHAARRPPRRSSR